MVDLQVNVACDRRLQPPRALPTVWTDGELVIEGADHLDVNRRAG